jgi:hypothetical protein
MTVNCRAKEKENMKPHRGTLILVFGILGFTCCPLFGMAAWIMGGGDLRQMDAGSMDPSGRGQTNIGRVLGMIVTILFCIAILGIMASLAVPMLRNLSR